MPQDNTDLPFGVPAYAAGAAAGTSVPTVAAVRASGSPDVATYLNPPKLPPAAPVDIAPAKPTAQSFLDKASALADRARTGIYSLLGIDSSPASATVSADRTGQLESDLDRLQARSSRPSVSTGDVYRMRVASTNPEQ